MTVFALSARDRKTLLLGGSVVGLLLLAARGVPAWRHWQTQVRADAITSESEAIVSQRLVHDAPRLSRVAQGMTQRYFALIPVFISGDDAAAQGAAFISTVNEAARMAGIQVGALQADMDTTGHRNRTTQIVPITVRGDGIGDINGVTHFLAALEDGTPLVSVRELSITPADPHASQTQPEALHVTFVIDGLGYNGGQEDDRAETSE